MSSIMRWRSGLVVAIGASCPERGGCDDHTHSDGRHHRSDLPAAPKGQVRSIAAGFVGSRSYILIASTPRPLGGFQIEGQRNGGCRGQAGAFLAQTRRDDAYASFQKFFEASDLATLVERYPRGRNSTIAGLRAPLDNLEATASLPKTAPHRCAPHPFAAGAS